MTTAEKPAKPGFMSRMRGALVPLLLIAAILTFGRSCLPGLSVDHGIGGPFVLVNGAGQSVTDRAYAGKVLLVAFGKPRPLVDGKPSAPGLADVMGKSLEDLSEAERKQVAALFIGLDATRDSPEQLAAYAKAVNPEIIGLGGSQEQIRAVADAYRVTYSFQNDEAGNPAQIQYSAWIYLMGPDGRFIANFKPDAPPSDIATAIRKVLGHRESPPS